MIGKNKLKNISDHESNQLLHYLAVGAIILIVFLSLPHFCSGCSHDHGHDHDHGMIFHKIRFN